MEIFHRLRTLIGLGGLLRAVVWQQGGVGDPRFADPLWGLSPWGTPAVEPGGPCGTISTHPALPPAREANAQWAQFVCARFAISA